VFLDETGHSRSVAGCQHGSKSMDDDDARRRRGTKLTRRLSLAGSMPAQDDEPPCLAPGPGSQPIPSNASYVS